MSSLATGVEIVQGVYNTEVESVVLAARVERRRAGLVPRANMLADLVELVVRVVHFALADWSREVSLVHLLVARADVVESAPLLLSLMRRLEHLFVNEPWYQNTDLGSRSPIVVGAGSRYVATDEECQISAL